MVFILLLLVVIPVEAKDQSDQANPGLGPNDIPTEYKAATSCAIDAPAVKTAGYSIMASTSDKKYVDTKLKDMIDGQTSLDSDPLHQLPATAGKICILFKFDGKLSRKKHINNFYYIVLKLNMFLKHVFQT